MKGRMESVHETARVVPVAERISRICVRGEISPRTGIRGAGISAMWNMLRKLGEVPR